MILRRPNRNKNRFFNLCDLAIFKMRAWPEGGDDQAGLGAAVALPDRAALESDAVGDSSSDPGSPRCESIVGKHT